MLGSRWHARVARHLFAWQSRCKCQAPMTRQAYILFHVQIICTHMTVRTQGICVCMRISDVCVHATVVIYMDSCACIHLLSSTYAYISHRNTAYIASAAARGRSLLAKQPLPLRIVLLLRNLATATRRHFSLSPAPQSIATAGLADTAQLAPSPSLRNDRPQPIQRARPW